MKDLTQQTCIPCSGNSPRLSSVEIASLTPQIPEWQVVEDDGELHLQRIYRFRNFTNALSFTLFVGAIAEEAGHHPVLLTEWGKVTVTWWTHAIGGLHQNDFIMAAKTDFIALNLQKMAEEFPLPSNVGLSFADLPSKRNPSVN
ncbi:pterin-4a-carbinolamine dehydratase [Rubidibacter lacunae KORDI 51-2]|uniref:Putative pterin-4-alpha-carbinolamine dehydratase n=1 Tax=Rubidibacter lacunae KORDI 51-2 TaxID=582515 RepID=U5DJF6_9CHRO|nr:pterin-4a-carbinolamine dehydratase [Rubidibacter lacunae KORDI 51-2]